MTDIQTPLINPEPQSAIEAQFSSMLAAEPKKSHTGLWLFILLILVLGGLGYLTVQKPELVLPTVYQFASKKMPVVIEGQNYVFSGGQWVKSGVPGEVVHAAAEEVAPVPDAPAPEVMPETPAPAEEPSAEPSTEPTSEKPGIPAVPSTETPAAEQPTEPENPPAPTEPTPPAPPAMP